jgi:hypothetical protein
MLQAYSAIELEDGGMEEKGGTATQAKPQR